MTAIALGHLVTTLVVIVAFVLVVRLTPFFWGIEASPRRAGPPSSPEGERREASHPG